MKKYRTVFIGNRPLILKGLAKHPRVDLVHAYVIQDSLISEADCVGVPVTFCGPKDAGIVLDFLHTDNYEICASAGCPYILPISKMPSNKIYINSHPSALPFGKGKHPINECIFSSHKKAGATLHYLVDEIDAGDIIYQETFDMTDEIDVDLLYSFIFDLEFEVFFKGFEKILTSDLKYKGTPQQGRGTYYSRQPDDQIVDVHSIEVRNFLEKVRAFSADTLGVRIRVNGKDIVVYKASLIFNEYIIERYGQAAPGDLPLSNKSFFLLKLKDGIVRIDKWV